MAASLIYGIGSGVRANYGILWESISQNSGVDYASVSFILAVAQLSFGIMQPVFGVLSMKKSSIFVLRCGVAFMVAEILLLPLCKSLWTLIISRHYGAEVLTLPQNFAVIFGFAALPDPTGSATVLPTSGLTAAEGYTIIWTADAFFSGIAAIVSLKIQKWRLRNYEQSDQAVCSRRIYGQSVPRESGCNLYFG